MLSLSFAVILSVEVEDKDATKLYGTAIEIYRGQELVAYGTAEQYKKLGESDKAVADFKLDEGVYFIKLMRGSYPDNVVLVNISGKEDEVLVRKLVIDLRKSAYTLYGQVIGEPADKWVGQKLYAVDEKEARIQEARIFEGGYYSIATMYPSVIYRLRLGDGEERQLSAPFSYETPGSYYLKMDLRDEGVLVAQKPSLIAPKSGELYARISVYIKGGEAAFAGEEIQVITPGGNFSVVTDESGMAQVQAAKEGRYIFLWKGQEAKTVVGKPVVMPEAKNITQESAQLLEEPIVQKKAKTSEDLLFGIGFAGVAIVLVVVVMVAVIGAFAFFVHKTEEKKPGKTHEKKKK